MKRLPSLLIATACVAVNGCGVDKLPDTGDAGKEPPFYPWPGPHKPDCGGAPLVDGGAAIDAGPPLSVRAYLFESCDHTIPYSTGINYDEHVNLACRWVFDDGGTAHGCSGHYTFSAAGRHTATVYATDLNSGRRASYVADAVRVVEPLAIAIHVAMDPCNLSMILTATVTGGRETHPPVHWGVSPRENVVSIDEPSHRVAVKVSAPGIYEIEASTENESGNGPFCQASASTEVTLAECDAGTTSDIVVH